MTVILPSLPDPFDLVIQGEQMRAWAMALPPSGVLALFDLDSESGATEPATTKVVAGEHNLSSMVGSYPVPNIEVLRSPFSGNMAAANAGIATPCGALIATFGQGLRPAQFVQSAQQWIISGRTLDSGGTPIPTCLVWVFEQGQMFVGGQAMVAQTISDGSGNYSVAVGRNTNYQAIGYKRGTPDLVGVTIDEVTPAANG